jgi:hypothetical protein
MNNNSFKLVPNEITVKVRKKQRNWFKIFLNLVVFSIVFIVVLFSLRSLWGYYSIYKHIPVNDVESYIIVDNRQLDLNDHWQEVFSKIVVDSLNIEKEDWEELRLNTKYYWGAYISDYSKFKINYLFYCPELSSSLKNRLKVLDIPFIYDGKVLLLNDAKFVDFEASTIFNTDIMNRLCAGQVDGRNFDCSKTDDIEISVTRDKIASKQRNFLNFDDYKDSLYFASNKLYWSNVKAYLPDGFMTNLSINDNTKAELLLFNNENSVFGRHFALVLKNMNLDSTLLEEIKYYVAYNNLQEREIILEDETLVIDYYLDFEKFSYLDNKSYKKIPLNYDTEEFLYLAEVNQNLVFTTNASIIDKLIEKNQMTNKSFAEYLFHVDSLDKFPYIDSVMNICDYWTIIDGEKTIIKSCE